MNVTAFTPTGESHPPYLSINEDVDTGKITATVRQGPADDFKIATIEIPFEDVVKIHADLGKFIERRSQAAG